MRIDTMGMDYCGNFIRGYGVAASSDNMSSAFGGGLLGTACIVAIYFLAIKK